MAIVSDSLYDARTAAVSYVSSNAYYGYVPPCRRENQLCGDHELTVGNGSPTFERYTYDNTAMETDDDGYAYSSASSCLNNDCVILEASSWNRLEANGNLDEEVRRRETANDADSMMRRRNRKRCNDDLGPARELKKFREGGGNSRVYYGTRSTKDRGPAEMHYESASLHLNTVNDKNLDRPAITEERCCWAAGNLRLISNPDCKNLSESNGPESVESSIEYEKILFETHGCSVYHHHRLQLLDNNCIEIEF